MAKTTIYKLGPDVAAGEARRDSQGRVVDDDYVAEAVADALVKVRGRGRPSLSESGESPLLRVRLSHELDDAIRKAAEAAGASRAEWVRQILGDASRTAAG
jgi:predicted HicB family RNase H-like nuclease